MKKVLYISVAANLLLVGLFLWGALKDREDRIRSEERHKVEQEFRQQIDDRMVKRADDTAAAVKPYEELKRKVTTVEQAVANFNRVVQLPKPIFVEPPQASTSPVPGELALPDAPSATQRADGSVVIPKESVVPLFQRLADCNAIEIRGRACQKDTEDLNAKVGSLEKELADEKRTRRVETVKTFGKGAAIGIVAGVVLSVVLRK